MLKKGDTILLGVGEYSDKCVHGPFRVLEDFDLNDACERWCGRRAPLDTMDLYNPDDLSDKGEFAFADENTFIAWLTGNSYLADIDAEYIHLGNYGRLQGDWTQ